METKNKKNRKNRRLLLSLIMILFTGVVLSTSTYAWFTANQNVTVSSIDVNVAAANGLQMSVDGLNWKTVISNSDITGASATYPAAVNQLPTAANSLVPVSTVGTMTAAKMDMFAGTIDSNTGGNFILTATQSTETNGTTGNFIAFDLFLQVNTATTVYLTSNSNVVASGTSSGIENAARIAFVSLGNVANGSTAAAIQGLAVNTNTPSIWELNYDVHTAAAVANASSNYGITTTTTGGSLLAYYGVKTPITKANDVLLNSTSTTYFSAVTPTISTPASGISSSAYRQLITLSAGITKLRVYMWVEGQDVDCENNASGGSMTYNIQLSTLANS